MPVFDSQGLTTDEIIELARLARAAYADGAPPSDWTQLTGADLGGSFGGNVFTNGGAAAEVYSRDGTLVVAFRGTDDPLSDGPDFLDIFPSTNAYIDNFNTLLNAVATYVQDESNGISNLQVTGHSLGGAAANILRNVAANRYDSVFDDAQFVAFAATTMSTSPGIFNIGFQNDWVFKAFYADGGLVSTLPTDFFASATDRIVWYNDLLVLNNDLGFGVRQIPEFLVNAPDSPHRINNHRDAIERISESEFYAETTRDMTILISDTDYTVKPLDAPNDNSGPALILGRSADDVLQGGASGDFIEGLAGADFITGLGGSDKISAGAGNDSILADSGNDTIMGGSGGDVIYYTNAGGNVQVDLEDGRASGALGNDVLNRIEHVVGGTGNDLLEGNASSNVLIGLQGRDTLEGENGNDILVSGTGTGNVLEGDAGNDVLDARTAEGATLEGGSGTDTFIFNAEGLIGFSPRYTVEDYEDGTDFIMIDVDFLTTFSNITITQSGSDTRLAVRETIITLEDTNSSVIDQSDIVLF